MKKNINLYLILVIAFSNITANVARAVCPVCVVAVGAGLGFSRWFGIDDVISSLWIGGVLSALSLWTIDLLEKKNKVFKFYKTSAWFLYYALVILPLYYYGIMGHPSNTIFGIDKILFGTVLGTIIFLLAVKLNLYLKEKNNGKVYFPYQKVVIPLGALAVISIITYFLI